MNKPCRAFVVVMYMYVSSCPRQASGNEKEERRRATGEAGEGGWRTTEVVGVDRCSNAGSKGVWDSPRYLKPMKKNVYSGKVETKTYHEKKLVLSHSSPQTLKEWLLE
ncbi:hypothetical protein Droror1_Dr00014800 [Drosera rotundifolia]